MRTSRKLLSILLALVMAVSLLPAAMAAEGEAPTAEGETHITILRSPREHLGLQLRG